MEKENLLAKKITTAGEDAQYDECCKVLLANKQILARILKACVSEFADCSIKDIEEKHIEGEPQISRVAVHQDETVEFIEGTNTEDTSINEGTVTYDIKFNVYSPKNGELIRMIINVEAQLNFNPGYPITKRGIYYCSRMISSQYGTEFEDSHYEKIKKVISIWVCTNPPKYMGNSITKYSMMAESLIGNASERKENYDLLTLLTICLGESTEKNYEGIIKMLDVLLSPKIKPDEKKSILHDEFDIAMTKKMESEAMKMCNLSQGIVYDATLEHIVNLMDSEGWTEERCMKALKIPENQQELYHEMLQDMMAVN